LISCRCAPFRWQNGRRESSYLVAAIRLVLARFQAALRVRPRLVRDPRGRRRPCASADAAQRILERRARRISPICRARPPPRARRRRRPTASAAGRARAARGQRTARSPRVARRSGGTRARRLRRACEEERWGEAG